MMNPLQSESKYKNNKRKKSRWRHFFGACWVIPFKYIKRMNLRLSLVRTAQLRRRRLIFFFDAPFSSFQIQRRQQQTTTTTITDNNQQQEQTAK